MSQQNNKQQVAARHDKAAIGRMVAEYNMVEKQNNDDKNNKRRRWEIKKMSRFILLCCFCLLLGIFSFSQSAAASEYANAYAFYQQNGNAMKFVPTTAVDGSIYYATKGKKGYNVSTLYSTIGWKVSVKHNNGTILQTMYFKLGGNYMHTVDISERKGYQYSLYSIPLSSIKSRMNSSSRKALESGNCTLVFDACIAVKKRGVLQGAMNDSGVTGGKVYLTYDGIAKAAPWSSAAKTALRGYYNRSVQGLFSALNLSKDEGIAWVKGEGTYCYGTEVTIEAAPLEGYAFAGWNGSSNYAEAKTAIIIGNADISLHAASKLSNLQVTYFRNTNKDDTKAEEQNFLYGGNPQKLKDFGWTKEGYYQSGWALSHNARKADYAITENVTDKWILSHLPKVNLYAIWQVNKYRLVFDPNGGNGVMKNIESDYTGTITLPENVFSYPNGTFLGWSINPLETVPEYTASQSREVKELAQKSGVANSNHAEIRLYAIWDNAPSIAAENIYVSLQDAKAGDVTEAKLASYAKATDTEDGNIAYGSHEQNSFLIENYEGHKFMELETEGQIELTFYAKDSSGNICRREITVFIVDTNLYEEAEIRGKVRFISGKYYKDENGNFVSEKYGGLTEDSIWKTEGYRVILDALFQ
uniref:InlB B-repeat-containing protein n=1 Tax=Agathobacter sp. TaxID=2021311 RepID=UPI004055F0D7